MGAGWFNQPAGELYNSCGGAEAGADDAALNAS